MWRQMLADVFGVEVAVTSSKRAYDREAHGTYRALYGDLKERFAAMAAPV